MATDPSTTTTVYVYDETIAAAIEAASNVAHADHAAMVSTVKALLSEYTQVMKGIALSTAELHKDLRSLVLANEYWNQINFVAGESVSHKTVDDYRALLQTKGLSTLIANNDLAVNNALPLSELSIASSHTDSASVGVVKAISTSVLLGTVMSNNPQSKLTVVSVSPGPNTAVSLDTETGKVSFVGLTPGSAYFLYTVMSDIGSSITGVSTVTVA